jgi:hypothetical protein
LTPFEAAIHSEFVFEIAHRPERDVIKLCSTAIRRTVSLNETVRRIEKKRNPAGTGFRRGGCARPDLFSGYRGCVVRSTPAVPEDTFNMVPENADVKGGSWRQ